MEETSCGALESPHGDYLGKTMASSVYAALIGCGCCAQGHQYTLIMLTAETGDR